MSVIETPKTIVLKRYPGAFCHYFCEHGWAIWMETEPLPLGTGSTPAKAWADAEENTKDDQ